MFLNKGKEYQNYRLKVDKLQEQVWRSEMERQELEHKFEKLMREKTKCEKSAIKVVKERYANFVEEDKRRSARNTNLLRMLERIDYQAATLAAKTERLKLLKSQHELNLMKKWNPTNNALPPAQYVPINHIQQQQYIPSSSRIQQHHHQPQSKYHSPFIAPAPQNQPRQQQQSFAPHYSLRNEANLKSDFVKYLSEINQFHDIYDKNTMSNRNIPTTITSYHQQHDPSNLPIPDDVNNIGKMYTNFPNEKFLQKHLANNDNYYGLSSASDYNLISGGSEAVGMQRAPYSNLYSGRDGIGFVDSTKKMDGRGIDNNNRMLYDNQYLSPTYGLKNVPNIKIYSSPHDDANEDIYGNYSNHEQPPQKNEQINNRFEFTDAIKSKLNDDEIIKNNKILHNQRQQHQAQLQQHEQQQHPKIHHPTISGPNDNLLVNNSSSIQTEINNTAVSISNTSANAGGGAINTNGVIKAIHHHNDDEDSVKFNAINATKDDEDKIDCSASSDHIIHPDYVNQSTIDQSIQPDQRPAIDCRNNVANIPLADTIKKPLFSPDVQIETKQKSDNNYVNDLKLNKADPHPTIDKIEEVFYGEKINHSENVQSTKELNIIAEQLQQKNENGNRNHMLENIENVNSLNAATKSATQENQFNNEKNENENMKIEQNNVSIVNDNVIAGETNENKLAIDEKDQYNYNNDGHEMKLSQSQDNNNYEQQNPSHAMAPPEIPSTIQQQPYEVDGTTNPAENQYQDYSDYNQQQLDYNTAAYPSEEQQQYGGTENAEQPYVEQAYAEQPYAEGVENYATAQYDENGQLIDAAAYAEPQEYYNEAGELQTSSASYGYENAEQPLVEGDQTYKDPAYTTEDPNVLEQQYDPQQYNTEEQYNLYNEQQQQQQSQEYNQDEQQQQQQEQPPQIYSTTEGGNEQINYDNGYQYQEPAIQQQEQLLDEYGNVVQEQPQYLDNNSYYTQAEQQPGENYYAEENVQQQQQFQDETLVASESTNLNEYSSQSTNNVTGEYVADANVYGGGGLGGEEDSSTTYSENVNVPPLNSGNAEQNTTENIGGKGDGLVSATAAPPNYLESETDDSSSQQVKEIRNDESDFDFSAN